MNFLSHVVEPNPNSLPCNLGKTTLDSFSFNSDSASLWEMKKSYFTGTSHPSQRNKGMANKFIGSSSNTWASSFFHFEGSGEVLLWNNPNETVQFSYPPAIHAILLKNEKRMVSVNLVMLLLISYGDCMGDSVR